MIPKRMSEFLHDVLPERTWRNRLQREDGRAYMEFGPTDVERLHRLGIEVDRLGPRLVVCMWDEESPLEIGGYLVVDNLAMGRPAMGGIRMLPDVTPFAIHNLARDDTQERRRSIALRRRQERHRGRLQCGRGNARGDHHSRNEHRGKQHSD
ncbi:MAG: hypothetical protein NZ765_06505 [Anaerolineae bacterium]|nr:hypothetical protein [Anaerolineae bacterium]MDW8071701.1 hypothetical protein [Anaerolineae bacterium]